MDLYIIQHRNTSNGDWACDDLGWETPSIKEEAVIHYGRLQNEFGPEFELRVLLLDADTNGFSDVTHSIEAAHDENMAEIAMAAAADAAHIRQETHGWEQV